jgi:hypothetical protein
MHFYIFEDVLSFECGFNLSTAASFNPIRCIVSHFQKWNGTNRYFEFSSNTLYL